MQTYNFDIGVTAQEFGDTREFACTARYIYHPAYTDRLRETPDEGASVTVLRVVASPYKRDPVSGAWAADRTVEIDPELFLDADALASAILAEHEANTADARDDAAEARRDAMRQEAAE